GSAALEQIVARWGREVLAPDGSLDRAALRAVVFDDPAELEALNEIVHPEVGRLRDERVAEARERGERLVVCDIPLLFERSLVDEFDVVVLVDAPRAMRLERLVRDRDLRETEAMAMIAAQMPAELKRARADVVIDNDNTPAALAQRVNDLWGMLEQRARSSTAELAVQRAERSSR
ncbi:MAG: dephospho-CoA kinase, partial [Gemmatirosa sp.]|nr:dephospho-CoA kinase [Gemmatirosa sp.]